MKTKIRSKDITAQVRVEITDDEERPLLLSDALHNGEPHEFEGDLVVLVYRPREDDDNWTCVSAITWGGIADTDLVHHQKYNKTWLMPGAPPELQVYGVQPEEPPTWLGKIIEDYRPHGAVVA